MDLTAKTASVSRFGKLKAKRTVELFKGDKKDHASPQFLCFQCPTTQLEWQPFACVVEFMQYKPDVLSSHLFPSPGSQNSIAVDFESFGFPWSD
jgi:hypothetical protein